MVAEVAEVAEVVLALLAVSKFLPPRAPSSSRNQAKENPLPVRGKGKGRGSSFLGDYLATRTW